MSWGCTILKLPTITHWNILVQPTIYPPGKPDAYRKTSNIRRTLVGNKIVDHSDVVGASPVGAAPTTSSFSTWHLASGDSPKKAARQYENLLSVGIWCVLYQRLDGTFFMSLSWWWTTIHRRPKPIQCINNIMASYDVMYQQQWHREGLLPVNYIHHRDGKIFLK